MAIDPRLKALRGSSRRDFIRYSTALAAALGVERSGLMNWLNDNGGYALAADVGAKTCSSIHYIAGQGGFANFTQPFPLESVAKSTSATVSYFAPGQAVKQASANRPWYVGPGAESPFKDKAEMTGFVAGTNQTHTQTPSADGGANSLIAACAAIQTATPTLLPVIAINPFTFGTAPGAPPVATVPNASGLIGLFNSAASRALLSKPEDAALHEQYFKAFLGLNAVAGRSTVQKSIDTSKVAVNLLAQNLSAKLTPTTQERTQFGYQANAPTTVVELIDATITGLKAMSLGLTSMIAMPAFRDDPHQRFAGGNAEAQRYSTHIAALFDGMKAMAKGIADPSGGSKSLWDRLVLTVHGDTYKAPFDRSGWGDGTPGNSNLVYLRSAGYIKTGWFGEVLTTGVRGWDPQTGDSITKTSADCLADANAAVLYAIAKGDERRVADFVPFRLGDGVRNPVQL